MAAPIPVKSQCLLLFVKEIIAVKKCKNLCLGLVARSSGECSPIVTHLSSLTEGVRARKHFRPFVLFVSNVGYMSRIPNGILLLK
jgi:hypothetical protein